MTPVTYFGSSGWSAEILRQLIAQQQQLDISIACVVTQPPRPTGRALALTPTPVGTVAEAAGIPVITASASSDLRTLVQTPPPALAAGQTLGILASFGLMIPDEMLTFFTHGILNVHPSLLPRWRGASPYISSILNGDTETGVTIISLEKKLDAGPIWAQERMAIDPRETTTTIEARLIPVVMRTLATAIPAAMAGTVQPTPQTEDGLTYAPKYSKQDGALSTLEMSAIEIDRRVRAFWPWPKTWFTWKAAASEGELELRTDSVLPLETSSLAPGALRVDSDSVVVGTKAGDLRILRLGRPGRPLMEAISCARGLTDFSSGRFL